MTRLVLLLRGPADGRIVTVGYPGAKRLPRYLDVPDPLTGGRYTYDLQSDDDCMDVPPERAHA